MATTGVYVQESVRFKIGDYVRHKDGGPRMEIVAHRGNECVCTWWAQRDMQKVSFLPEMLVAAGITN